ncbi:hypothetical protein SELMODRAFT_130110, partial [Selaginella moellendorffii]
FSSRANSEVVLDVCVQMGYRHFDTAAAHGTEEAVGKGLKKGFVDGLVKREEVFVTYKFHLLDAGEVRSAVEKSLSALQLEYLDLCLVQSPSKLLKSCTYPPNQRESASLPSSVQEIWEALEDCVQSGLTKAMGVCNFSAKNVKEILESASVVPAVNQVELHPMWQQKQLREFCQSVGVRVSSWRPLGGQPPLSVLNNSVIKEIAETHGKTPNQIALRWLLENGVISVIQSYDPEKLLEYINLFDFKFSVEDLEKLASLDQDLPFYVV